MQLPGQAAGQGSPYDCQRIDAESCVYEHPQGGAPQSWWSPHFMGSSHPRKRATVECIPCLKNQCRKICTKRVRVPLKGLSIPCVEGAFASHSVERQRCNAFSVK